MYPILFKFGPITVYSFGLFMALAALSAAWVVSAELKRRGYNSELASTLVFAAAVGGLKDQVNRTFGPIIENFRQASKVEAICPKMMLSGGYLGKLRLAIERICL